MPEIQQRDWEDLLLPQCALESPDAQRTHARDVGEILVECDQFQAVIEADLRDEQIHCRRNKAARETFLAELPGVAPETVWCSDKRQKRQLRLDVFARSRGSRAQQFEEHRLA